MITSGTMGFAVADEGAAGSTCPRGNEKEEEDKSAKL